MTFGSASTPTSKPPAKPATPWVWNTPKVSSTFWNSRALPSQFQDIQTSEEATTPMTIAPKLLTKPAAGVMATRPVIIPLTAPRKVGLRCLLAKMSQITQVSSATAVVRLVLSTASDASAPEKYGSPPLNPFQPNHRIPAPTAASGRLFGTAR